MAERDEDPIALFVKEQWEKGDRALTDDRRHYWLNYAFFQNEQWVAWHSQNREVIALPRDKGDDRVRLTDNRIQPNLIGNLAKLSRRTLSFEVPPSSSDDAAISGAHLAQTALEHARREGGWERVRLQALTDAFFGGTSAVVCEWDPEGGEELGVDPASGQVIRGGTEQLTALAITEFTIEPGSRDHRDARFFIMAKALPPDQVQEHYKLKDKPDPDTMAAGGPLQRRLLHERGFGSDMRMTSVFTLYARPCKEFPEGKMAVVIGNKTVIDKPWPFPRKDRLNIRIFRQQQLPGRWTGQTMLNAARPLQVIYNFGRSMLAEHMKLAGTPRLAIPDNSGVLIEDLDDSPGQPFYYDGVASRPPNYVEAPNVPRWLIEQVRMARDAIDDIMAFHDISRGQAPGDRNSGLALSVLAEKDETPLGLMAHDQAEGWSDIASFVLALWAENVTEFREARVPMPGVGVPMRKEWTGRHLAKQTTAVVPLDSTLPFSRAAMQAWLIEVAGHFPNLIPQDPQVLARILELPNQQQMAEAANADVAQAQRENHLMLAGEIPGLGDDPFPMPWDEHAVHIAEHNRLRKSSAYIWAPKVVRDIIDMHIAAHEKLVAEEVFSQAQKELAAPGAAAIPQGNEPIGTAVPPDFIEQTGAPAAQQQQGVAA